MVIASGKIRWPSLSFRKLVPRAIDGPEIAAEQMRDHAARDPRVEHHRVAAGRHLARAEPLDRTLAGALADLGRVAQIGGIDRIGEIVVALHLLAGAADHRDADRVVEPA